MRIASYAGERSVTELAERLFALGPERSAERRYEAEQALLVANPDLRDLANLAPGTLLVVPEVHGLEPTSEASPVADVVRGAVEALHASIERVGEGLEAAAARGADRATLQLKLLRSREVKDLAEGNPELSKRVSAASKAAEKERSRAKDLKARQPKAVEQLRNDLEEFLSRHF